MQTGSKVYEFKSSNLSFKDIDIKQGIVTGYFSAFDNVDSDRDIIRKGAFLKSISENGPHSARPRIKHLLNHYPSMPLGNLTELKEDSTGLYYESKIGSHSLGQDFLKMVESELIKEHSVGFQVVKRNQLGKWEDGPEVPMWELTELKLFEGSSLTAWGANPNTPLTGMKGATIDIMKERMEKLEKFCKNATATDETIELLLLEVKQLQQYILDLSTPTSTPAAEEAQKPQPDTLKGEELLLLSASIENLNLQLKTWN